MYIYVEQDDHETYITFASATPHRTRSLLISFMEDKRPDDLINDLRDAGWAEDNAQMMALLPASPLYGRLEISLWTETHGLFQSWTDDEKRKYLASARRVLKKYGMTGVPHRKLTYADMA